MRKEEKKEFRKIQKKQAYDLYKSKTIIKNMGYKDAAPFVVTFMNFESLNNGKKFYDELISNMKCEDIDTNQYKVGSKLFTMFYYDLSKNINTMIDLVKASDYIIFYPGKILKKDLLECINVMNSFGVCKLSIAIDKRDRGDKEISKRISKDLGFKLKPQTLEQTLFNFRKFKNRPVEFKCSSSYLINDKIEFEDNQ